ncbi:hydantoinase B/oxoprolinase family protein [Schinkia azotoformans]|uniref:hydantoinase B/oxoprolinase family protein n=1 Tax=Schinkia azotoformans TaxID=1454 RepID=UPI002E1C850F|nr:hydantoinase B/oxoprolinase family protein [Schinkia azotoformans]
MSENKKVAINPILASVIQRRLNAVTHDMAKVLQQTSRSPVFNEAGDFVTGLFDHQTRMMEQSANIPIIGFGAQPALPYIMEFFKDDLYPGDVIVHNDVYEGGNQTHDVGIYKPVFYQDELVGWTVSKGHLTDLGGATAGGYNPQHTEVWQEAIRIPGVKIIEKGKIRRDVWKMLFANVRVKIVEEDVKAMIGACNIGERGLLKVVEKYGLETFRSHLDYIIEATEKQTKEIIRRWRPGTYYGVSYMVSDGVDPLRKYKIAVKITINDDGKVKMDFTGTDKQAPGFTNMPPAGAKAACAIAYLMLINPGTEIAQNEGLFSSLDCYFPKGSILNPNFPAATIVGNQIADVLLEAIMDALKDAVPDQVTAGWCKACPPVFTGTDPRKNEPYFDFGFMAKGGQGALEGFDGFNGIGFAGAAGCMRSQDPEMLEIKDPFFMEAYEYLPDSAGAGKYRGGYGTYVKIRIDGDNNAVGTLGDGMEYEGAKLPHGLFGGREGMSNNYLLYLPDGTTQKVGSKDMVFQVPKGTWLEMYCGGGGGYGSPILRDINKVQEEVSDGLLSIEKAKNEYGVEVDPKTGKVNLEATNLLRKQLLS